MEQDWFEMKDVRKRKLDNAVWVPLRANYRARASGQWGHIGYTEEFLGLTSVAIPLGKKSLAEKLEWTDIGIRSSHRGGVEKNGQYIPADQFDGYGLNLDGVFLILDQDGNNEDHSEWHLHQDVVITLGLKREGDHWVSIDEGYIEVARLKRDENGKPVFFDIRAEHLKDYLCARRMALYVSSYRDRQETFERANHISWPTNPICEVLGGDRWEGRITEIDEGGSPFGSGATVVLMGRTGISSEDIPEISASDESITSKVFTLTRERRKLFRVQGELWRNEWVNPAEASPRIRRDKVAPSVFFLTDNAGKRESRETLVADGKWLWFSPAVMMRLAHHRGGGLSWTSKEIGSVRCSPNYGVVFGVNSLGLINVYAKDIALLPDWQQQIWAGFNISPEGGVSDELFAAQAKGLPAETYAPETLMPKAIESLNNISSERLHFRLFGSDEKVATLIPHIHRFRAVDFAGLLSLAKDLARLIAERIDTTALKKLVGPDAEKLGSLKTLEKVLSLKVGKEEARRIMGPLFGIYELRLADAHLGGSDLEAALKLAGVESGAPFVLQGDQLMNTCAVTLYEIAGVLEKFAKT